MEELDPTQTSSKASPVSVQLSGALSNQREFELDARFEPG